MYFILNKINSMGIKSNYRKFLCGLLGEEIFKLSHISDFAYKKLAIDTTLFLYKFKAALGDKWLTGFLNLIKCLRRNQIHCVFIFDGKSPVEKKTEQESRREKKRKLEGTVNEIENDLVKYYENGVVSERLSKLRKTDEKFNPKIIEEILIKKQNQIVNISSEDFELLKNTFDVLSIPYYTAVSEAEKFCSKLCLDGLVDGVISDDTDVIAYGAPISISKLNSYTGVCNVLNHETLINNLDLTKKQFLDHCILCGTDYNKNLPKIGAVIAYKYIQQYKTIEDIGEKLNIDISILNHKKTRCLFTDFENYDVNEIPYCGKPDFNKLNEILLTQDIKFDTESFDFNLKSKIKII